MELKRPKGIRKGQQLFNFLEWVRNTYEFTPHEQSKRMADPFNIADHSLDKLYEEYLETQNIQKKERSGEEDKEEE